MIPVQRGLRPSNIADARIDFTFPLLLSASRRKTAGAFYAAPISAEPQFQRILAKIINLNKNETDVIFIFGFFMSPADYQQPFLSALSSEKPCFGFADNLQSWLDSQHAQLKKRERTSLSLQISGCQLLDRDRLSQITVSKLCKEAGIAQGTFYLHFKDRHDFVSHLLRAFIAFLQIQMKQASHEDEADSIRATTAAYYRLFEANLGLMKCLIHHLDDFPETRDAFLLLNREWADRVTQSVMRRWEKAGTPAPLTQQDLQRRAYALGGLVDQYLNVLLLHQDPYLSSLSQDKEAVIDSLSDIWKRGLAL